MSNTDLPTAIKTLLTTLIRVERVLSNPALEVDAVGFGDSLIDLIVHYWTMPQKVQVRQSQTRVIFALKSACEQASISILYPIRTLYHYNQRNGDGFAASRGTEPS